MIDLRSLEAFVWVSKLGKFNAAARKLHLTQPAISTRIAMLEEELGVAIFDRGKGKVTLSEKGRELVAYAERMLQLREGMQLAANEKTSVRRSMRIGVADTLVYTWVPDLITRVSECYPALELAIQVDVKPALLRDLRSRQIDLALLIEPVPEPDLRILPLSSYSVDWIASESLALHSRKVRLEEIARWPIVTYLGPGRPHDAVHDLFAQRGLDNIRLYTSSSMSTMITMIRKGLGIGVIPSSVVAADLQQGALRTLSVDEAELPALHFVAAYPKGPEVRVTESIARLAQEISRDASGAPVAGRGTTPPARPRSRARPAARRV